MLRCVENGPRHRDWPHRPDARGQCREDGCHARSRAIGIHLAVEAQSLLLPGVLRVPRVGTELKSEDVPPLGLVAHRDAIEMR